MKSRRRVGPPQRKLDAPLAQAKARALAAGMAGFDLAMKSPAARALLGAVLPKLGEGPSEQTMASGWFTTELIGRAGDGRMARARIAYDGDPGNRATLRILCESGLCLAFDGAKLPGGAACGGVLTHRPPRSAKRWCPACALPG